MDSLFDQLKSEPAVQHEPSPKPKPPSASSQPIPMEEEKEDKAVRRESMPPPSTSTVIKSNNNKSRSLSPPKSVIKSLKVKVERAKLADSILFKEIEETCTIKETVVDPNVSHSNGTNRNLALAKQTDKQRAAKLVTPTKAQQKLFDPDVLVKAQQLTKLKVKRCLVRLPRQDLQKLQKEMQLKIQKQRESKNKNSASLNTSTSIKGKKRKNNNNNFPIDSSPSKKGKRSQDDLKQATGFFIKLNELTKPSNKIIRHIKDKKKFNSAAKAVAGNITTTKPTKFTRTQLIKLYGKRFFRARVKIERCTHPMMLIFESNARARRLQSKRNKSKNLSVSFRDQVEIFGDSTDSEPESSQLDDQASTSFAIDGQVKPHPIPSTLLAVTPARLKKVENGKVVDDIELDTSLFVVPATGASTPFASPGRKRREKKSFSPLKGDGTPSPRKEQLKLANEKMPPSGLRRLPADEVDDEDDEDDECEYIVPIDIPERRTSRTSSSNTTEEVVTSKVTEPDPAADSLESSCKDATLTSQESSVETFASAIEQPPTSDIETSKDEPSIKKITDQEANNAESLATTKTNGENDTNDVIIKSLSKEEEDIAMVKDVTDDLPKLTRIGSISPAQSLNSLNDLVDSLMNNVDEGQSIATSGALAVDNISDAPKANDDNENEKLKNVPELLPESDTKLRDTLTDDISLQLFAEDDPNNVTGDSTFLADHVIQDNEIVDGIVKERIDELTEEKQLCSVTIPKVTQTNDVAE